MPFLLLNLFRFLGIGESVDEVLDILPSTLMEETNDTLLDGTLEDGDYDAQRNMVDGGLQLNLLLNISLKYFGNLSVSYMK